jgi:hypothetical protein
MNTNIRRDHGPLGALYPPKTWTAPNPHGAIKEGDTPSWFYFLPIGLNAPERPEWGGWGGRFRHVDRGLYRDAEDTAGGITSARATVWRWRPALQNEFQARMDWCVRSPAEANHPPVVELDGDRSRNVLEIDVKPRSAVHLTAQGSKDRDGDTLAYRWWVYKEAGTYGNPIQIEHADGVTATVHVPADSAGETIHVILEVTDDGTPPLTSHRRIVLRVE